MVSEGTDVLYDNVSPPDPIEWAGIKAVKQVMRKKTWLKKELGIFGENAEIDYCLIIKLDKKLHWNRKELGYDE